MIHFSPFPELFLYHSALKDKLFILFDRDQIEALNYYFTQSNMRLCPSPYLVISHKISSNLVDWYDSR